MIKEKEFDVLIMILKMELFINSTICFRFFFVVLRYFFLLLYDKPTKRTKNYQISNKIKNKSQQINNKKEIKKEIK